MLVFVKFFDTCDMDRVPIRLTSRKSLTHSVAFRKKDRLYTSWLSQWQDGGTYRKTVNASNGVIKRTSFIQTFNMLIDEHYRVTVSIMEKKGIQHSSNTRLRDYINYVFTVGSIEQQEEVFRNLLVTPAITNKKIIFIKVVSMDT